MLLSVMGLHLRNRSRGTLAVRPSSLGAPPRGALAARSSVGPCVDRQPEGRSSARNQVPVRPEEEGRVLAEFRLHPRDLQQCLLIRRHSEVKCEVLHRLPQRGRLRLR